jgi:hypothetical protein
MQRESSLMLRLIAIIFAIFLRMRLKKKKSRRLKKMLKRRMLLKRPKSPHVTVPMSS